MKKKVLKKNGKQHRREPRKRRRNNGDVNKRQNKKIIDLKSMTKQKNDYNLKDNDKSELLPYKQINFDGRGGGTRAEVNLQDDEKRRKTMWLCKHYHFVTISSCSSFTRHSN